MKRLSLSALIALISGTVMLSGAHSQTSAPPLESAPPALPASTSQPVQARLAGQIGEARLSELSGLASSRRYAGGLWAHNDSGDQARLFLLDAQGRTRAVVQIENVKAEDWEDIAVAGDGKKAWIYIADIGDNRKSRANITIYRLREPALNWKSTAPVQITARAGRMTLQFPDGAHDAETLLANRRGELLIVTKTTDASEFFQTPLPFRPNTTQTLRFMGARQFGSNQPGRRSVRASLTTGGDLSPDGRRAVIITYKEAHLWNLRNDWSPLWTSTPRIIQLPPMNQSESVAWSLDSKRLWLSSEGAPAPLWELTP